jgi:integrase
MRNYNTLRKSPETIIEMQSDSLYKKNDSISFAKSILEDFKKDGTLLLGDFLSDSWTFIKNPKSKTTCTISFIIEMPDFHKDYLVPFELKNMMKSWCSETLLKIAPQSLLRNLRYLKEFILVTNSFNENFITHLSDWFSLSSYSSLLKNLIIRTVLNFLDYSSLLYKEDYVNELVLLSRKYIDSKKLIRKLPNFPDVLTFGDIINNIISEWNSYEKIKFYPIILWWKITNIIPLRPSELCDINRNCLSEKKGRLFITVPRKKQSGAYKKIEVIDTLEINKTLHNLISEYINLTNHFGDTLTLFSYPAHLSLSLPFNKNVVTNYFNYNNLYNLLDTFYKEIVEIKFKLNLERIELNDTRHFAFCSMMLQGFNALTIARIGGHRSLESQYAYQQHIDYFIQSKVYNLSNLYKIKKIKGLSDLVSTIELEDAWQRSLLSKESHSFLEEVEIGYCTDELKNCQSDKCQFCDHWWISRTDLIKFEPELRNIVEIKNQRIQEKIKFMGRLSKEMEYDFKKNRYSPFDQERLSRESKGINGDLDDYAKIQVYIDAFEDIKNAN